MAIYLVRYWLLYLFDVFYQYRYQQNISLVSVFD